MLKFNSEDPAELLIVKTYKKAKDTFQAVHDEQKNFLMLLIAELGLEPTEANYKAFCVGWDIHALTRVARLQLIMEQMIAHESYGGTNA
jgi:hypothetical protein